MTVDGEQIELDFFSRVSLFSKGTVSRLVYTLLHFHSNIVWQELGAIAISFGRRLSTRDWHWHPKPSESWDRWGDWGPCLSSVFRLTGLTLSFRCRSVCVLRNDFFVWWSFSILFVWAWETWVCQWAWNLSICFSSWLWFFGNKCVVDPLKQLIQESWNEIAGDSEHF